MRWMKRGAWVVIAMASTGCGASNITDQILLLLIPPRPIAFAGTDAIINPGQVVTLDGSQSGTELGDQSFESATQSNLTFQWTIVEARDTTTGASIDLPGTGAAFQNGTENTSFASFTANTPADYRIRLTVSDGTTSADDDVIVRVQ